MAQQQTQPGKPKVNRLPLMGAYSNRGHDPNKDQRFVNMFPETRKVDQLENTKIFINKRPGLSLYKNFMSGLNEGRAFAFFKGKFYAAIGNKVIEDGNPVIEKLTLSGSTGNVAMFVANSATIGDYLFIADGTYGWIIKSDGSVADIRDDMLYNVTLDSAGNGYGSIPTVTVSAPPSGTTAVVTASVSAGAITNLVISNAGTGYTTPPTITIAAPQTTFDPTTTVILVQDTITIANHTYGVGNAVTYGNGGGGSIGGLTNGTVYYTIVVDSNTIKLATSSANATNGVAVDITSIGTGTAHTLTGSATATATATINAFPSPHVPMTTFIDGYMVLAKGSDVYTCDLDDPLKWSSNNFLTAEMFPDEVVSLARQNNQVVVFGHTSIEFFYDAANASGSPLSRNDSTTIQMGTAMPYGIYQNEQLCAYISASESGGRAVWVIKGFQPQKVSDEYIERILDAEVDMTDCRAYGLRTKGHLFYVINLKTINRTLVYDVDEKLWHEWSSNFDGNHTVFECDYMADNSTGMVYLLHKSNGNVYTLDPSVYTDNGNDILCELVTNRYDMDTYHRKFMCSAKIVGDRYSSSNSVILSWTNDDYETWSNPKTITLTDDFPAFQRLGVFRRRAFKITHNLNQPLRLESLEVEYNEGST